MTEGTNIYSFIRGGGNRATLNSDSYYVHIEGCGVERKSSHFRAENIDLVKLILGGCFTAAKIKHIISMERNSSGEEIRS